MATKPTRDLQSVVLTEALRDELAELAYTFNGRAEDAEDIDSAQLREFAGKLCELAERAEGVTNSAAKRDRQLAEQALTDREPGLELVRRMFGFVTWGMDGLPSDDPMREPLVSVGEILTDALAETVAS